MGRPIRVVEGSKNLPELRAKLDGFMLRVKKEDVLTDLPPVRWDTVPVEIAQAGIGALKFSPAIEALSDDDLLNYLSTASGDDHIMRVRHMLGLCKVAAAVEYIDDFLTNLPAGKKVLVFAHHRDVIEKLVSGLGDYSPLSITGSSTISERATAIDTFLNDHGRRLLIGNIQAAGTGLTLVGPKCACSDVIFVEASYSVGDNVQAAARVHRIGQREAVVARFLTAHETLDDRIQDILARKARDFSILFD
jgi:SWI/SNF-related matrix-associated actin-dependent regulator 1 of chromatin subfamily A